MTIKPLSSATIRRLFLDYFADKGHKVVHSASLVPGNDPTLLFTNAGMVPFKDVFVGAEKRDYQRAVTAQRCVRAGGKHNDLENVGYTARHHTFFEMLGNFSFGDYFKSEAIAYAWELITKVYGLPESRLWVTVYAEDDEAYAIWHEQIGVPAERIIRIGDKVGMARYESDNFWAMGETGPCGPCSEIFYDHGEDVWGGPPGSAEEDGDRYIEIWNLVFMQFERDAQGKMKPLPKPSIDTGMGLERMAAVLQGVHSNYEIDIFQTLIHATAQVTNCADLKENSLKVIADHIRATVFLMADGVLPSNEGRGYVLRRIMRRAIRHGHKLGQSQAFFHRLVAPLVAEMGEAYPEIVEAQQRITTAILREEERFALTLDNGMAVLEKDLATLEGTVIGGETVFKLYDTYGFPVDLTADIARERGLTLDMDGYDKAMQAQQAQAKAGGKFKALTQLDVSSKTRFEGYALESTQAQIVGIFVDAEAQTALSVGDEGVIVLDNTPFYGESGGQVGDSGEIRAGEAVFVVSDTQKQGDTFLHIGRLQAGQLALGANVAVRIDHERRTAIKRHHSATHLLHKALREVLGEHVQQKGSLVDERRTRFDFSHDGVISAEQVVAIEVIMNRQVLSNAPVEVQTMPYDQAREKGAMALFGEKYGDVVRVVSMGEQEFSIELCGGTHVDYLGEIGLCKIIAQSAVSAGVRRVEVVCGLVALAYVQAQETQLQQIGATLKTDAQRAPERIAQLQTQVKTLEKDKQALTRQLATGGSGAETVAVKEIKGWRTLALLRDGLDNAALRDSADQLRDKHELDVVVLGSADNNTARLVVSVAKTASVLHAGQIIRELASFIDGKGGGRPDFAQAGGKNPAGLAQALNALDDLLPKK